MSVVNTNAILCAQTSHISSETIRLRLRCGTSKAVVVKQRSDNFDLFFPAARELSFDHVVLADVCE
jgi:hypothetical protein